MNTIDFKSALNGEQYAAATAGEGPMLILAGGKEMILDDSVRLTEAARRTGVEVELIVEDDMFHVWPALLPRHPATARALARSAEFIMERVPEN